jgi:hypothetical protein
MHLVQQRATLKLWGNGTGPEDKPPPGRVEDTHVHSNLQLPNHSHYISDPPLDSVLGSGLAPTDGEWVEAS